MKIVRELTKRLIDCFSQDMALNIRLGDKCLDIKSIQEVGPDDLVIILEEQK